VESLINGDRGKDQKQKNGKVIPTYRGRRGKTTEWMSEIWELYLRKQREKKKRNLNLKPAA
jgi:hypothetical protein